MRLNRFVTTAIAALAMVLTPMTALAASEEPWEFDGGGWGHGLGLSQFGALGQAQDGRDAEEILQYYYQGTSLGSMPGGHWTTEEHGLWVGLVSNTGSVDLGAAGGAVTLCQPAPGCEDVSQVIEPGESWRFEVNGDDPNQCRLRQVDVGNTGWSDCKAVISDLDPSARVEVDGREYARGTLRFDPASNGFHVVVTLDIETYLYGLAEVPSSWPSEALQAQAIIGRSYALATAADRGGSTGSGKLGSCGCHLRDTTADQAYVGWSKEDPANGGTAWKAAVDQTAGEILTHPSSPHPFDVAKAFYSSSNGGASENNEDVWPGSPIPWLRSVEDPWSADPDVNPLAEWTVYVSEDGMEAALGWDYVLDATILEGPPGVLVEFTGKDNGVDVSTTLNGTDIRSILNTYGYVSSGSVRVSPYISAVTDPPGFDDIPGHTFENAIEWLRTEEITVGCTETEFCPDRKVKRGEMAVFISRADDLPPPSGDYFRDDDGKFYEGGANRLYEAGISTGCGGQNFCGDQYLPRKQMAALLVRALDLPPTNEDFFVDDEGSPYEDAINRLAAARITVGCNPPDYDRFCPDGTVTRGQMAAFFKRSWGP